MKKLLRLAWPLYTFFMLLLFSACSPLKSSPHEQKHQIELTLHEMQTNLDDLRHDIQCYQTEFQILDEKIKHCEDTLNEVKQSHLSQIQHHLRTLKEKTENLENKTGLLQTSSEKREKQLQELSKYANETTLAFTQYKKKIQELESQLLTQKRKFSQMEQLQTTVEEVAHALEVPGSFHLYQVKPGDSLEKIAKKFHITVDRLKEYNHLEKDLIVSGQKLKIPQSKK